MGRAPVGPGRPDVSTLDEAGRDGPEEGIAVRRAPDGQRQPTARPQDPAGLREGRRGNGHQHEPELAEHPVDGVVVELDSLGVGRPVVDILYAELGSASARASSIAGERSVVISRPLAPTIVAASNPVSPIPAASSSSVSPSFALKLAQHPLPDRRRDLLDVGTATLPGRRDVSAIS